MSAVAIGCFDDEGPFLRARTRALALERRILGEWMPYASDVLGHGRNDSDRDILGAVLAGGFAGGIGLFALESWSAVVAYPFDSGARPLWSWPAFVPAPVEFSALAGAVVGLVAMFWKARLTRLNHPAFDWEEVGHASRDAFVLALGCDAGEDANAALAILAQAGATHSRLIEA